MPEIVCFNCNNLIFQKTKISVGDAYTYFCKALGGKKLFHDQGPNTNLIVDFSGIEKVAECSEKGEK